MIRYREVHEGFEVGQRTWGAGRLSSAYCHIKTIGGPDCVMILRVEQDRRAGSVLNNQNETCAPPLT
jgi:hypothetical protein